MKIEKLIEILNFIGAKHHVDQLGNVHASHGIRHTLFTCRPCGRGKTWLPTGKKYFKEAGILRNGSVRSFDFADFPSEGYCTRVTLSCNWSNLAAPVTLVGLNISGLGLMQYIPSAIDKSPVTLQMYYALWANHDEGSRVPLSDTEKLWRILLDHLQERDEQFLNRPFAEVTRLIANNRTRAFTGANS